MIPAKWIIDAINVFLKYMYTGNQSVGEVGKPPGEMFAATGWYYDADGKHDISISVITGNASNNFEGDFVLDAPTYYAFTTPSVADMSTFELSYWSGWAQLKSGANFDFYINYPGSWTQSADVLTFGMDVDSGQSSWWITPERGALPAAGGGSFTGMKLNSDAPVVTNDQDFIDNATTPPGGSTSFQIVDLDIDKDTQYTYNQIMNIIIPAVQVYYPDVSATDFISESDILATETETETETGVSEPVEPFTLNYDEILSEDELESILTQETYEISEIESITETIIIDIEDLVIEDNTEYQQVTDFIPDALAVGMDVFNELNVAAPLTSAAVIACLWKIIRGT